MQNPRTLLTILIVTLILPSLAGCTSPSAEHRTENDSFSNLDLVYESKLTDLTQNGIIGVFEVLTKSRVMVTIETDSTWAAGEQIWWDFTKLIMDTDGPFMLNSPGPVAANTICPNWQNEPCSETYSEPQSISGYGETLPAGRYAWITGNLDATIHSASIKINSNNTVNVLQVTPIDIELQVLNPISNNDSKFQFASALNLDDDTLFIARHTAGNGLITDVEFQKPEGPKLAFNRNPSSYDNWNEVSTGCERQPELILHDSEYDVKLQTQESHPEKTLVIIALVQLPEILSNALHGAGPYESAHWDSVFDHGASCDKLPRKF